MLRLRYYQRECKEAIEWGWEEHSRLCAKLPTGAGKNIMAAKLLGDMQPGRCLFIADQDELCDQPRKAIQMATGIIPAVEKAKDRASLSAQIVVASSQSLSAKKRGTGILERLHRYPKDHFQYIISDEVHRGTDRDAIIWDYFAEAKVCGMTATPFRQNLADLSKWFPSMAYQMDILDLVEEGFAPPPVILPVPLQIDISEAKTRRGMEGREYDPESVDSLIAPYYEQIADFLSVAAKGRRLIVFNTLIKSSEAFAAALRNSGIRAHHVDGGSANRDMLIEGFSRGDFDCLSNSNLLCLDSKTEILTRRGFVAMNEMKKSDLVANWCPSGHVFFRRPKAVIRRDTKPGEIIVSSETKRNNFRVTANHDMIVACCAERRGWKLLKAAELKRHSLPSCGVSDPDPIKIPANNELSAAQFNRKVASSAYAIRSRSDGKITHSESLRIAKERTRHRQQLSYRQPHELSIEECWIIGFWIADGCLTIAKGEGTRRYSLAQSEAYPTIIKRIDTMLRRAGIISTKHRAKPGTKSVHYSVNWTLPIGNTGNSLSRNGIYRLIPYLKKSGSDLLWGLNEDQFDSIVWGYWAGDGHHLKPSNFYPRCVSFNDTKYAWLDLLSTIGCVRGWRCSLRKMKAPTNPNHNQQWFLAMSKGSTRHVVPEGIQKTPANATEKVWCVSTDSGSIMTRRGGRITVMGNSTGVDIPSADAFLNLRLTTSRSWFQQARGRVMRVLPNIIDHLPEKNQAAERKALIANSAKKNALIFDILLQHDKLGAVHAGDDFCRNEAEAKALFEATKKLKSPEEISAISRRVQMEREAALVEALERAALSSSMKTPMTADQIFAMLGQRERLEYIPIQRWEQEPATEAQIRLLESKGVDAREVKSKGQAKQIIDCILDRVKLGFATIKQVKLIKGHNLRAAELDRIPNPEKLSFEDASRAIDGFKKQHRRAHAV